MINKKESMNYNLSEHDLINYNQTSFSIGNNNININNNNNELNISGSSNDKSQENLIEIELKNIHMLILQRSLYIMKKRFEKNKKEVELVYEKYKDKNYRNLKCVSTLRLFDLYKEIMDTIQINLLPYENFNELITADLMTKFNEEKYNTMINALVKFTKKNIEKYNKIFYENKMKKKKIKEEQENKKNPKPEEVEVTDQVKIVHKDKRGEVICNFEKMIENNKKIDIKDMIFSINEDDMSILINKKLLYSDVIPLIIADFLQEYMKNNIYIGIILSNNYINENDDLNENIKALYDKEIIKKYNNLNKIDPKEEKNEKLKNLLFESNNMDNQIRIYNELIVENSNKGMESSYLMEMVRKLKAQKIVLQKKINEINKKKCNIKNNEQYFNTLNPNNISSNESINYQSKFSRSKNNSKNNSKTNIKLNSKKISKNEIRQNNLFEIFSFYSKQHILLGLTPTIDSLLSKEKHMNLSEFAKFCIEFKILIKNNKINEIFKKYAKGGNYMSFEEFIESLNKLASIVNEERKQIIKKRINLFQLQLKEMIEKEKKKKNKKNKKKKIKIIQKENNNNEEIKNDEQPNNKNAGQIPNQNENVENTENKENKDNKENAENKIINETKENNINKQDDNKGENKEENKEIKENKNENKKINSNSNSQKKLVKKEIKDEKPNIILNTKEELEEQITKLQNDYRNLENKSFNQLIEELYIYLEIDDNLVYRQKMVGYIQPFLTRGKDTRNPEKNVKYPIKFNPKNIREMYDLLMKRNEDLKKENEIKKMKEKDLQFEKRKKKFNKELKKLEKDYDEKIKKDNYQQIKRSEEDYIREKNNKLTWQIIQKCDYQTFLLNEDGNNAKNRKKNNNMQSHLDDIFVNQSNQLFEKDDEDFINKIYSNQTRKQNYDDYMFNSRISSQNSRGDNYVRNSHVSLDSNKRYKLGKRY